MVFPRAITISWVYQEILMSPCGSDFGTSNTAIGVGSAGRPVLAPVEGHETLIPSAVFFDYETKGKAPIGPAALASAIPQQHARLSRALRGRERVARTGVVEIFVRRLKRKGGAFAGEEVGGVVHGRPVRFVDDD